MNTATLVVHDIRAWKRILFGNKLRTKITTGLIILIIWQLGVQTFAPAFVAKPLNVALVFPTVLMDSEFLLASLSTLTAVVQGLTIALVAGTIVGVAMGGLSFFDRMLNFYVNGLYTMPMVALLPLITIWFGYEDDARLATVIFAGFFSIVINARDGAQSVPNEYLEVCKAYRAPTRYIWFDITVFFIATLFDCRVSASGRSGTCRCCYRRVFCIVRRRGYVRASKCQDF